MLTMNSDECVLCAGIEGRDAGVLSCGKLGGDDRETATLNVTVTGMKRLRHSPLSLCLCLCLSAVRVELKAFW